MGRKRKNPPETWQTKSSDWKDTHYSVIFDDLYESAPFRALSLGAVSTFLALLHEYKGNWTGNTVVCPIPTIQKYAVTNRTSAENCVYQLEIFGFIDIESGSLRREPSKYTFSDRWKELDRNPKALAEAKELYEKAYRSGHIASYINNIKMNGNWPIK